MLEEYYDEEESTNYYKYYFLPNGFELEVVDEDCDDPKYDEDGNQINVAYITDINNYCKKTYIIFDTYKELEEKLKDLNILS